MPEHPVLITSSDGTVDATCDKHRCSDGYIETEHHKYTPSTCLPCPGVSTTGTCMGACSGSFGGSGTCHMPNHTTTTSSTTALLSLLAAVTAAAPVLPVCKCAPFYGGVKCDHCLDHRTGYECTKCLPGRQGSICEACPGLNR